MSVDDPDTDAARRLLNGLTTAVVHLDARLHVRYLNPAAEMLLHASARQTRGRALGHALPALAGERKGLLGALASGNGYTVREQRMQRARDDSITVDCTVTPIAEPGGDTGLLLELVQRDRQLQISREEKLFAQHQASRELVRGLAHEIKNPLGGLRGAAQLLEAELENAELKEYTGVIMHEADRLRALVDRMLGPSQPPEQRPTNVHEVLEHVTRLVRGELPAAIGIERDYDPSIPDVRVDRDQLVQAVLNLVRNAVQALGGAGTIRLRTRTRRLFTIGRRCHRLVVRVDIIDDGPGITPDVQEQMFYPLVTTRAEGSGLGLSIAQYLVRLNGGIIECDSRPGATVFSVYLPLEAN